MGSEKGNAPVITVMLAVEDAPRAIEWYKHALGATELWIIQTTLCAHYLRRVLGAPSHRMQGRLWNYAGNVVESFQPKPQHFIELIAAYDNRTDLHFPAPSTVNCPTSVVSRCTIGGAVDAVIFHSPLLDFWPDLVSRSGSRFW